MIQVIERAADILTTLAAGDSSLAALAARTGVQKTTLCNILRTLREVGYVERTDVGSYRFGRGLIDLTRAVRIDDPVETLGRPVAERLAGRTGEDCVIAVLRGGRRTNVVRISSDADVVVNERVYLEHNVYRTATGRLLLAHAGGTERGEAVAIHGLPGADWDDIDTQEKLDRRLDRVRKLAVVRRSDGGTLAQFAAAVVVGGRVVAAVGVSAVGSRCTPAHVAGIESALKKAADDLSAALSTTIQKETA